MISLGVSPYENVPPLLVPRLHRRPGPLRVGLVRGAAPEVAASATASAEVQVQRGAAPQHARREEHLSRHRHGSLQGR